MNKHIGFFPQLDALRAIAVFMTLLAHFLPALSLPKIPYLWLGVDVFFTISGFLITGILLKAVQKEELSKPKYIYQFAIRRALRLFPAYYLLITVFWTARNFAGLYIWNNDFNPWFFLYVPNWFFFFYPGQESGSFNHIWSLGVEEQFYLIWPWLILFVKQRYLKSLLIGMIAFSVVGSYWMYEYDNARMLPFLNFHTLGAGALLAYFFFIDSGNRFYQYVLRNRVSIFFIALAGLLVSLFFWPFSERSNGFMFGPFLALTTAVLVLNTVVGVKGITGRFFDNGGVKHLGKISYGIYLYHMPIPDTLKAVAGSFGIKLDYNAHPYLYLLLFFALTLIIAQLSYKYIEQPFLKLKNRVGEKIQDPVGQVLKS